MALYFSQLVDMTSQQKTKGTQKMKQTTPTRTEKEVRILRELGYEVEATASQPEPASPKNLLARAMEYSSRAQWQSGESIRLWQGTVKGSPVLAYLKNDGGTVSLNLTGAPAKCTLFILTQYGWEVVRDPEQRYQEWVAKINAPKRTNPLYKAPPAFGQKG